MLLYSVIVPIPAAPAPALGNLSVSLSLDGGGAYSASTPLAYSDVTVSTMVPRGGPTAGGTAAVLRGAALLNVTRCRFGWRCGSNQAPPPVPRSPAPPFHLCRVEYIPTLGWSPYSVGTPVPQLSVTAPCTAA